MQKILKAFAQSVLAPFFLAACMHSPADRHSMDGWSHMMGFDFYGGGFMWLLWIVIAVVVVYFIIGPGKKSGLFSGPAQESALDILKKRYAKGEISKEEFEERKKNLED